MRKIIALGMAALFSLAALPAVAADDPAGTVLIENALTAAEDTANPEFEAKAAISTAGVVKSAMEGVSATAIDAALQPSHYLRWKPAAGRLAAGTYEVWSYNIGKIDSTEKWRGGAQVVSDPYAKFLIKGAAGTAVQYVNQATATGGQNDWLSLGIYTFTGDGEEYVELNKTTNPGWSSFTYGDDIKFVPVTVNENKLLHVYAVADGVRLQEDEAEVTGDRIVKRIPVSAASYTITLEATPGAVVTVDGAETNVVSGTPVPGTADTHSVTVGDKTYTLVVDMEDEALETIALSAAVTTQKVGANAVFKPAALTADKAGWYNVYINVSGPQNYVNTEKIHVAVSHAGLREETVVKYGRYANQSAWVFAGKYYFSGEEAQTEQITVTKALSNTGDYMVVQNVKLVKAAEDAATGFAGLSVLTDSGYKSIPAAAFDADGKYTLPAENAESVTLLSTAAALTVNGETVLPMQAVALAENAGQISVTAEEDGVIKTYTVYLAKADVTVKGEDATVDGTPGEVPMLLGEDGQSVKNVANTGGSLTYTATIPATGTYRILAWRPAFTAESDTLFGTENQPVEIKTAQGMETVSVDWKSAPSGWVDLGVYKLDAETSVKFTKTEDTGFLLADDVVFVKQSVQLDSEALDPEELNGYQYSIPSDSIRISANLSPYMKVGSTVLESGKAVSVPLSSGKNTLTLSVYSDSTFSVQTGVYTFSVLSTGVTVGHEDATKTGAWTESTVTGYESGRKAITATEGGTLVFPAAVNGLYEVLVWRGEGSATYMASVNGKQATIQAGGAGWISLGSYSFTGAADEGVTVSAAAGSAVYADAVRYVQDDEKMVAALKDITDAAEMKTIIEAWAPKWGISMDGDFAMLSTAGKTDVYEALCGRKYADVLDVAKAFEYASAVVRLNEATVRDTVLLTEKADILAIDVGENSVFTGLSDKAEVYEAMLGADLPPADKEAVQKTFENACTFARIQTLTTANQDELPAYAEKMGADLSEYEELSKTKQGTVIKNVMRKKPFKDAETFLQIFEDAVEEAAKPAKSPAGSSSSGRGSGGGGGMSFAVDDKTLEAVKDAEPSAPPSEAIVQEPKSFPDVPASHWASESINALHAKGILSGYEDGMFRPDDPVKREEFVKILIEALPIPVEETNKVFSDVSADDWFYAPVMQAYAVNLVKGVDYGVFGTGQYITREQLCTIVWRGMKICDLYLDEGEEVVYTDENAVADYALEAVKALSKGGVVSGMGDGNFVPGGTATRAQVAKIIHGLLKGGVAA